MTSGPGPLDLCPPGPAAAPDPRAGGSFIPTDPGTAGGRGRVDGDRYYKHSITLSIPDSEPRGAPSRHCLEDGQSVAPKSSATLPTRTSETNGFWIHIAAPASSSSWVSPPSG